METDQDAELRNFKNMLSQTQEKMESWMGEEFLKLEKGLKLKEDQLLQKSKEEKAVITDKIKKIKEDAKSQSHALKAKSEKLEKLKQKLEEIDTHTDAMLDTREKLESDLEVAFKQIAKQKEVIASQDKECQKKLDYLRKAAAVFENRLGLKLRKTRGGRMQFVFDKIDPEEEDRIFCFFLKLEGADRKYIVQDCDPEIDDLALLTEKLNQTNNLKSFVIAMRKRFKAKVSRKKLQAESSK
ncbi:hypothetical protein CHS0354_014477 [Potamilus streckersoni]|uniref:Kinetochore protein SPC25 n=1 Tax=Potamilus streckersoni TaxID=2493646 RepID=A0AAE0SA71_9BIVA|nr:hypothetical protein CHS0354_014477 [Potamilus streckersoni]